MSATPQTSGAASSGGSALAAPDHHVDTLDKPATYNPDRIGWFGLEYDGPRCVGDDCRTPVDNDGEMCEECGDNPHEFRHDGDPRFPNQCACGRIEAIGGYSPVHDGWAHQ